MVLDESICHRWIPMVKQPKQNKYIAFCRPKIRVNAIQYKFVKRHVAVASEALSRGIVAGFQAMTYTILSSNSIYICQSGRTQAR